MSLIHSRAGTAAVENFQQSDQSSRALPLGAGVRGSFAKNGREALHLFAEHQPAVVVADWRMLDIGGLELCRRIRQDFADCYRHLILITRNSDLSVVMRNRVT